MIGLVYAFIIILANSIGAVSGMGGGVLIKPIFDLLGYHSVASISFYSAVAVFTMSIVSTYRQVKNGIVISWAKVFWIALGSLLGGYAGNAVFGYLLAVFGANVTQLIQIILTVLTLVFALIYSLFQLKQFQLKQWYWFVVCGTVLGFLASLLGIGGGPINVSLLMLMFSLPIKEATVYSICTIFFSQLSKLATIAITGGLVHYDLMILIYVIPAAIIGGFLGAQLSKLLPAQKITQIFRAVIVLVILLNLYNGFGLL
ncbi:sulfite exporter TauE/SafE family protein [Streptococcus merionis]|uniref:sulfite exporter TauE/SafE family protein n=1 Tax=Streptococcus merionis TaxID=400065 RepID=UPI0035118AA9